MLLSLIFVFGCASSNSSTVVSSNSNSITNTYAQGLAALKDGDYERAQKLFEQVLGMAGGGKFSTLAILRLADVHFFKEDYGFAERSYRRFIDTVGDNPQNPWLDYAYFRMIQCQWNQRGEDFFLVPPVDRRDQTQIIRAYKSAVKFFKLFPNSPYYIKVYKIYKEATKIYTSYNLEVARFYLSRDKVRAAIMQLRDLMEMMPQTMENYKVLNMYVEALGRLGNEREVLQICMRFKNILENNRLCKR